MNANELELSVDWTCCNGHLNSESLPISAGEDPEEFVEELVSDTNAQCAVCETTDVQDYTWEIVPVEQRVCITIFTPVAQFPVLACAA